MAVKYKIIEESIEDSFELIAIHSNLSSYALAYQINEVAALQLARAAKDLEVQEAAFPIYEWEDETQGEHWQLLSNSTTYEAVEESIGLFATNSAVRTQHLIDERKEIDYFLKISSENPLLAKRTVKSLMALPKVTLVYQLDVGEIKSNQNLIFY